MDLMLIDRMMLDQVGCKDITHLVLFKIHEFETFFITLQVIYDKQELYSVRKIIIGSFKAISEDIKSIHITTNFLICIRQRSKSGAIILVKAISPKFPICGNRHEYKPPRMVCISE